MVRESNKEVEAEIKEKARNWHITPDGKSFLEEIATVGDDVK